MPHLIELEAQGCLNRSHGELHSASSHLLDEREVTPTGAICAITRSGHSKEESLNVKAFLKVHGVVYDTGPFLLSRKGLSQRRSGGVIVYERQDFTTFKKGCPELKAYEVRQELTFIDKLLFPYAGSPSFSLVQGQTVPPGHGDVVYKEDASETTYWGFRGNVPFTCSIQPEAENPTRDCAENAGCSVKNSMLQEAKCRQLDV